MLLTIYLSEVIKNVEILKSFKKTNFSYDDLSIIPTKEYDYSMKLKTFVHSFSNLRIVHIGDVHLINIFM